jgi:hypothetical protein
VEAVTELIKSREQELDLASQLERLQLPDTEAMEWRDRRPAGTSKPVDSDDSDQVRASFSFLAGCRSIEADTSYSFRQH